jgi:hypothetical protein
MGYECSGEFQQVTYQVSTKIQNILQHHKEQGENAFCVVPSKCGLPEILRAPFWTNRNGRRGQVHEPLHESGGYDACLEEDLPKDGGGEVKAAHGKNVQDTERRKTKADKQQSTRPYVLKWYDDGDGSGIEKLFQENQKHHWREAVPTLCNQDFHEDFEMGCIDLCQLLRQRVTGLRGLPLLGHILSACGGTLHYATKQMKVLMKVSFSKRLKSEIKIG